MFTSVSIQALNQIDIYKIKVQTIVSIHEIRRCKRHKTYFEIGLVNTTCVVLFARTNILCF